MQCQPVEDLSLPAKEFYNQCEPVEEWRQPVEEFFQPVQAKSELVALLNAIVQFLSTTTIR